ncbi:MAG: hypothetical protein HC896_11940 [Bacteroidales bacterium]|nr:hypothetical protein [Bacteroidales bacterium]
MKTIFVNILMFLHIALHAQDNVRLYPTVISENQPVKVIVPFTVSSTCHCPCIDSSNAKVVSGTIYLNTFRNHVYIEDMACDMYCHCSDTIALGKLSAGNYTLFVTGNSIDTNNQVAGSKADTLMFEVKGSNNASNILTVGEAFDFEVGDEFHIRSSLHNQPPNAERLKVISKSLSADKDTVVYEIAKNNYASTYNSYPEPHLEYSFGTDTIKEVYTNLDLPVAGNFDTALLSIGKGYCGIVTYKHEFFQDSAIGIDGYILEYGKGVGLVKHIRYEAGADPGDYPVYNKELFYYKKSGATCGTPDLTTGTTQVQASNKVAICPNPATNNFALEISQASQSLLVDIIDLNGRVVLQKNFMAKTGLT